MFRIEHIPLESIWGNIILVSYLKIAGILKAVEFGNLTFPFAKHQKVKNQITILW